MSFRLRQDSRCETVNTRLSLEIFSAIIIMKKFLFFPFEGKNLFELLESNTMELTALLFGVVCSHDFDRGVPDSIQPSGNEPLCFGA